MNEYNHHNQLRNNIAQYAPLKTDGSDLHMPTMLRRPITLHPTPLLADFNPTNYRNLELDSGPGGSFATANPPHNNFYDSIPADIHIDNYTQESNEDSLINQESPIDDQIYEQQLGDSTIGGDIDEVTGDGSEQFDSDERTHPKKLKVKITRTVKTTKLAQEDDKIIGIKDNVKHESSTKEKELAGPPTLDLSSSSARSLTTIDDVEQLDSQQQNDQNSKLTIQTTASTTLNTSTTSKPNRVSISKPNGIFSLVNNKPTIIPANVKPKSRFRGQANSD